MSTEQQNLQNLYVLRHYQQAYLNYCLQITYCYYLCLWIEAHNQLKKDDEVKQKSALRGKNFDSQPNQEKLTFKSLKHKEKAKVKEKHATGLLHEAFGEVDYSLGTVENNYLFTGEQYDNNVGFYYLRARFYNPSNGRFTQMDTYPGMQFEPVSLHKYLYANANPVMFVDPSGNISMLEIGIGLRIYAQQLAYAATPALYLINHVATKIGSSQVAMFIKLAANRFTGGIYKVVGLSPKVMKMHAGQVYEKILNPAMRLIGARAQQSISTIAGNARPDWILKGKNIIDAKLGQHLDFTQLAKFAHFAQREGGSITYVTLTRVPPHIRQKAYDIIANNPLTRDVKVSFIPLTFF